MIRAETKSQPWRLLVLAYLIRTDIGDKKRKPATCHFPVAHPPTYRRLWKKSACDTARLFPARCHTGSSGNTPISFVGAVNLLCAERPPLPPGASRSQPATRAWALRPRPPLLPVAQRGRREAEPRRELRLTQPHLCPDLADVDLGDMNTLLRLSGIAGDSADTKRSVAFCSALLSSLSRFSRRPTAENGHLMKVRILREMAAGGVSASVTR